MHGCTARIANWAGGDMARVSGNHKIGAVKLLPVKIKRFLFAGINIMTNFADAYHLQKPDAGHVGG